MKLTRFSLNGEIYYGDLKNNQIHLLSDLPWNNGALTGEIKQLSECKLLAPYLPNKIICTAINYPGATGLESEQNEPLIFLKATNTVIGNGEKIISPFDNLKVWGEPELGILISRKLSNASIDEAKESIFGYLIANDVTVENINNWDHHLARSKSIDTFCVLGPYIDTDFKPENQRIQGLHNDILLRDGILSDRINKEPDLLVSLSQWITLNPGDIIITGSPTRVREREYFKDGDTFECRIDGLGSIKNKFSFKE